jgi:hypothetical protein
MRKRDVSAARDYLAESAVFGEKRVPTAAFDYGDQGTVLLHLKRVGSSISDMNEDNYGMFLGKHADGYVVAIKNFMGTGFSGCEVFDTEAEMKISWQLD